MVIDIPYYISKCAPHVAPITMRAIIQSESKGNYLTIGLNHGYRLRYQPKSYTQAASWVTYLEKHKYNFDIGLAQVNINNVHKFGYTGIEALDPCTNIKISAKILAANYNHALYSSTNSQEALLKAISAYNTGNNYSGFQNGYVKHVVYSAVYLTETK